MEEKDIISDHNPDERERGEDLRKKGKESATAHSMVQLRKGASPGQPLVPNRKGRTKGGTNIIANSRSCVGKNRYSPILYASERDRLADNTRGKVKY